MTPKHPHVGSPSLAGLAWRNLWRNRRRTLITLSSIVFGVFLAILMTAMQDKNWAQMIDLAARLGTGHVTIQHVDYQDAPSLSRSVTGVEELAATVRAKSEAVRVAPRISGNLMLSTARESFGAGFLAYDPALDDETTLAVLGGVAEGEPFETADDKGILLGARLGENLRAELGDKVVYTLTDKEGEITSGLARVRGLVRTGSPAVDAGMALLPIGSVRELVGYGEDEATQLAVFVEDHRQSDATALTLQGEIGGPVSVLAWRKARPELATFIAMKVGGALVFQLLVAVLVAAGIFNTLFVSVMERVREFGIMLAIGWSPGRLFRMVMWESLWLALVGLALAALVTIGPYLYLASNGIDYSAFMGDGMDIAGVGMSSVLLVGIYGRNLALIGVAAFLAVVLSGVYPAWRAGRVDPIETIQLV